MQKCRRVEWCNRLRKIYLRQWELIENTGDIKHRAGEISILSDRNKNSMKNIIEYVQSKIVAKNENGENMLISPFDVKLLDINYGDYNG